MPVHAQGGLTVTREGFEEYILDCKARNLRDGTINHYQESIKQIYKRIAPDTLISSMCQQTMANFYISLRDDPNLNDVSMGTYARDLKTLMRFFMKRKYLPRFEIPLPKASKTPIQTYTDDELKKLLKKPDVRKCIFSTYRSWVIVNFLLSTGVRQNSLINVKIRDVDFDNSVVYVNMTKNRKPLIIPLNEDILKILKEYLQYRGGEADDWLFCSVYGKQLTRSSNYHALWDYCHERGVEQTGVHRFRHTFAKSGRLSMHIRTSWMAAAARESAWRVLLRSTRSLSSVMSQSQHWMFPFRRKS